MDSPNPTIYQPNLTVGVSSKRPMEPPLAYPYFRHRWFEIDENDNLMVNSPWGLRYQEFNFYTPVQRAAGISSQYRIIGDFTARVSYRRHSWYTDNDNALPGGDDYSHNLFGFAVSAYDANLLSYDYPRSEEAYFDSDGGGGWPFIGVGYAEGKYFSSPGGATCDKADEDFTGADGSRPSGWSYRDDSDLGGTEAWCKIYSNKLKCYAYQASAGSGSQENNAWIREDAYISDDFEATIDVEKIALLGEDNGYGSITIGLDDCTNNFFRIYNVAFRVTIAPTNQMTTLIYPGGSSVYSSLPPDSTKLKFERSGTTVSISYYSGGSWVLLASATSSVADVRLWVDLYSVKFNLGDDFAMEYHLDNWCVSTPGGGGGGEDAPNRGAFIVDNDELNAVSISNEDDTIGGNENYTFPESSQLRVQREGDVFYASFLENGQWVWYDADTGIDVTRHQFTYEYGDPVTVHIFFQTMYRGQMDIWIKRIDFDYYDGVICPDGTVRWGYP